MKEEISKQYEKGLVDLMSIVEPLIDKFKANKNSIDIQQLELVAEYLLTERKIDENYIDELEVELDKEKEKNKKLEDKIKGMYDKSNKLIEVTNLYLNSIPKSKVKEKIEEFNIPILDVLDKLPIMPQTIERGCGAKDGIIYVLQELLEEGE